MDKITKCKTCGADIAKSAKVCPACGAKQKKHIVLGIILAIIGLSIIGAALGKNSPQKVGTVDTQGVSEPTASQNQAFLPGDVVALNDIEVTFVSCSATNGNEYFSPETGNVFLLCEFVIDNKSSKDIAVSSIASFEAYVDDYSTQMSLLATMSADKSQLDGSVAAGKKMSGVVGYEVPNNWETLEIRFTPDFWSGKSITFIANR